METLIGITFDKWLKLLAENNFRIHPARLHLSAYLTLLSLRNSRIAKKEHQQYGDVIEQTTIEKPPIFILGHWRSGTTLLHNIISLDSQFAYPNLLEIYNPRSFLIVEEKLAKRRNLNQERKRPMDNVTVTPLSPGEEEFALSTLSLKSPLLAWNFPANEAYYDQFLTFKSATPEDIAEWKQAYLYFLKKLTYRYEGKQLLLKSPPNTARIRLLLELFPDAKFVHIHRNPVHVFQSTLKLYKNTVARFNLQGAQPESKIVDGIIRRYGTMYRTFFEEINQIPPGNYVEIAFEELERDFYGTVEHIYQQLELPGFDAFSPRLREKTEELKNYKKNKYPSVDNAYMQRLYDACPMCFDQWGYPVTIGEQADTMI